MAERLRASTAATPPPNGSPANGAAAAQPPARSIPDDAIHSLTEWTRILGLAPHCLKREVRLGRLRASKRAGRLWSLGRWLREWLEAGEVKRQPR
jgi:hypothetical protein